MKSLVITIAACVMVFTPPELHAAENPFQYVAEMGVPQSYQEDGVVKGFAPDLLAEIWKRLGMKPKKIQFLPWDKAYQQTLTQPGTVLLAMARLEERERLFKWVGPINTPRFSLLAHKNRNIKLASLDEAQGYRIGTVINDAAEMLLLRKGFSLDKLDRAADVKGVLGKLQSGKVDMIAYSEMSLKQSAQHYGMSEGTFITLIPISGSPIFFAFHKDTPDSSVRSFQETLNTMKMDGTYRRIKSRYGFHD